MWKDKDAAKSKQRRTAERYLWFVAIIGGSLGIYFGTKSPLYHKAAKGAFKVGIPLLIGFQLLVVSFMIF